MKRRAGARARGQTLFRMLATKLLFRHRLSLRFLTRQPPRRRRSRARRYAGGRRPAQRGETVRRGEQ
eukprot:1043250-Alexandrium_andersonii.AAC.1